MAKVRLRDLNPAEFLNNLKIGGKVGIGTGSATLTEALEVIGSIKLSGDLEIASGKMIDWGNGDARIIEGETQNYSLTFKTWDGVGCDPRMKILGDGKVGIGTGTVAPAEMLTINSASNTRILLQEGGSDKGKIAAGGSGLYIQAAAGRINFRNTSDVDTVLIEDTGYVGMIAAAQIRLTLGSQGTAGTNDANWIQGNGTQLEYNSASSNHNWEVGGSAKMRLDSTGRLGIGTGSSTLSHPLEVWHGTPTINLKDTSSSGEFRFTLDGVKATIKNHSTNGALELLTTGTGNIVLSPAGDVEIDGKVGIGTGSTVNSRLHIRGNSDINDADCSLYIVDADGSPAGSIIPNISFRSDSAQLYQIRANDALGLQFRNSSDVTKVTFGDDGRVGIGVDPASIPASYAGALNVNSKVLINSNLILRYGLSNGNNADFYHNGQTLTIASTGNGSGVGDGHIILNTTRNVGVGSFSGGGPTYNLHVEGSMYANTITVGTGFNDLINAGQLTARKSSSGNTADTDAALVVEDSTNAILEFLTQAGNGGTINFSSNKKGVCQIKAELPNKLHFYAGEAHQLTLNQSGSNNVNFSKLGAGTVQSDSSGNLSVSSSAALKTDVQNFISGLSSIINLRPVKFKWKEETGLDHHNDYVGFIAEEVEEELPDAVLCPEETCTPDGEMAPNNKSKGLSDRAIIAALVNSIIELNTRIEQLENN